MKFEIGMMFREGDMFKVTGRSEKTITFKQIQHYGKFNERTVRTLRVKVEECRLGEICCRGSHTFIAADFTMEV